MRFIRKTHYAQDFQLFRHEGQVFWYGLLAAALLVLPFVLTDFYLGELSLVFIYAIAGIGLMLLTGYTGLVSLGHAAFLAIGAYSHAYFLSKGWPFLVSLPAATLLTAIVGGPDAVRQTRHGSPCPWSVCLTGRLLLRRMRSSPACPRRTSG